MRDFARSHHAGVQAQLDRLAALTLPQGRIGLDAMRQLLGRLGNPQDNLPPVFHVAGTNGKGSVCAYLRAMLEAQGLCVHATTSPHLVRYNERIRIAGSLVADEMLAALLAEVLDAGEGLAISFFETTIAASFLAFARTPADACVIEVGLGGRFDATNVIPSPAACAIATLGIDHERFLLAPEDGTPTQPLARIAFEKAGIMKSGSPVATFCYPPPAAREVEQAAARVGAPLFMRGRDWDAEIAGTVAYKDRHGTLTLPLPALHGTHQADNAALAVAMLRHQDRVTVSAEAMAEGIAAAAWPARLQRLDGGALARLVPDHTLWLDGGHNPDAGVAIAQHFAGQNLHLILGMIAGKDPDAIAGPLQNRSVSLQIVPVPGQDYLGPETFGEKATSAGSVTEALRALPRDELPVLIAGSLYLAGDVLRANGTVPD